VIPIITDKLLTTELENAVELVDPQRDALYEYDSAEQQNINKEAPWKKE
jgi:COP9 signalosome complex subunit 5